VKRFTAAEKWDKAWFRKLSPKIKCLWLFLCDRCDQAGVIDIDWDLASFQIGEKVSKADLPKFENRIVTLPSGSIWIPSFVEFQYGKLSDGCPAHKPIRRAIEKHFPNGYPIGYQYPIDTLQEEEEEKEEEQDKKKKGKENRAKCTREELEHYCRENGLFPRDVAFGVVHSASWLRL